MKFILPQIFPSKSTTFALKSFYKLFFAFFKKIEIVAKKKNKIE